MASLVAISIFLGKQFVISLLLILGCLILDEIYVNFFKLSRKQISYFLAQLIFLLIFVFFNFLEDIPGLYTIIINASLVLNVYLLYFLFKRDFSSRFFTNAVEKYSLLTGVLVSLPIVSLSALLQNTNWEKMVIFLLLFVATVDTAAWFFGKNFGKNKLWPSVSPKKTIEGSVGGLLAAVLVSAIYWSLLISPLNWKLYLSFAVMGVLAQFGDLIQSKLKRIYNIKDSSNLIPGHGGIYDRLDSLIFVAPVFVVILNNFL